jgi:hypothetical protein
MFFSNLALANDNSKFIANILIQNDFEVWLDDGKALFDWEKILQKSKQKQITTNVIHQDFIENQVLFNKKYNNKWLRINGIVENVKIDKDNSIYINLVSKYKSFRAYSNDSDFASTLKSNDHVDLYCFNIVPSTAPLMPYSTSKCVSYESHILGTNFQDYLKANEIKQSYKEFEYVSELLALLIPTQDIKNKCDQNKISSECLNLITQTLKSKETEKKLKKILKDCEKSNSEYCLKFKAITKKIKNSESIS